MKYNPPKICQSAKWAGETVVIRGFFLTAGWRRLITQGYQVKLENVLNHLKKQQPIWLFNPHQSPGLSALLGPLSTALPCLGLAMGHTVAATLCLSMGNF